MAGMKCNLFAAAGGRTTCGQGLLANKRQAIGGGEKGGQTSQQEPGHDVADQDQAGHNKRRSLPEPVTKLC
jgi:hypothetical protein